MISKAAPENVDPRTGELLRLYAWVWLPGQTEPVPAGVLTRTDRILAGDPVITFTYGRTYLQRRGAISLFDAELPLTSGTFDPSRPGEVTGGFAGRSAFGRTLVSRPRQPLPLHGCVRDGGPDAWGRRVINLRRASDPNQYLSELTYLRESGSDRIGALDFQDSPQQYEPRGGSATLQQLLAAAERLDAGEPLPPDLLAAAGRGTSIGGARPKALLTDDSGRSLIAKFPSSTDIRPVVRAEAVSMLLAGHAGLDVARVEVRAVDKRDVLIVERFDRGRDGTRRALVSGLTILGEHEMGARHASYADLAESIRVGPWTEPGMTLQEMYRRLVFNVCAGNTDDHLRIHAASETAATSPSRRPTTSSRSLAAAGKPATRSRSPATGAATAASQRLSPPPPSSISPRRRPATPSTTSSMPSAGTGTRRATRRGSLRLSATVSGVASSSMPTSSRVTPRATKSARRGAARPDNRPGGSASARLPQRMNPAGLCCVHGRHSEFPTQTDIRRRVVLVLFMVPAFRAAAIGCA